MKNKIDIKELWNKQEAPIPDSKELFKIIYSFKKRKLLALIAINIALLLTCIFIGFVWYTFQPEMITTKIGIVLAILAMALYLVVSHRMIPSMVSIGYDMNTSQCLQQLLKFKEKQLFLQKTILNIYCILLSAGFSLYLIEYTLRMKLAWAIVSYIVTILLIGIVWFDFRLRKINKEQTKTNWLINELASLNRQLTTNK